MDEWFEVEVKTDQGWGLVCLPPPVVHGGLVPVETAKRYMSLYEARDHGTRYGLEMRVYRCAKDQRELIA